MKILLSLLFFLLALGHAPAASIIEDYLNNETEVIPDGDLNGIVQTLSVTSSNLASIDSITVSLKISGGWNGDFYAYLSHNGKLSVLLNRTGRTTAKPDGSSISGFNVTFDDTAPVDIHLATDPLVGPLTGTFQADARKTNPATTLNSDIRTAPLALFNNESANGNWVLFIADVAAGDQGSITSWGIKVTGPEIVPEPGTWLLLIAGAMLVSVRHRLARPK